ncbi:hypothetical protein FDECE_18271 [Fusarium decemcellulare]|nr:hypothetical protein FDECE_18271 [Fusarium decemcellulare]
MIENLPPEVWSLILEWLGLTEDFTFSQRLCNDTYSHRPLIRGEREAYTTLNSLSRASRRLHALSTPELYRTLIVDDYSDPLHLLTTLSQSPYLRGLVKELHLHLDITEQPRFEKINRQRKKLFIAASPGLELPPETQGGIARGLGSKIIDNAEDATLAFWLALMPNLRALSLSVPRTPFLTAGLFSKRNFGKRFPLLEEMRMEPGNRGDYRNPQVAIGFFEDVFSLPSIKTLRFHHVLWKKPITWEDYLLPDISCKIENLQLVAVDINYAALDTLLSRCHNLCVLNCDLLVSAQGFDCGRLGDILRAHGETLEVLDLQFRTEIPGVKEVEELVFGRIGSLRSLPRLAELIGPLHALVGFDETKIGSKREFFDPLGPLPRSEKPCLRLADVLPDSLETMQFTVLLPGKDWEDELRRVTECKRLSKLEWVHTIDTCTMSNFPADFKCKGWVSDGNGSMARVRRMDKDPSKKSEAGTAN